MNLLLNPGLNVKRQKREKTCHRKKIRQEEQEDFSSQEDVSRRCQGKSYQKVESLLNLLSNFSLLRAVLRVCFLDTQRFGCYFLWWQKMKDLERQEKRDWYPPRDAISVQFLSRETAGGGGQIRQNFCPVALLLFIFFTSFILHPSLSLLSSDWTRDQYIFCFSTCFLPLHLNLDLDKRRRERDRDRCQTCARRS